MPAAPSTSLRPESLATAVQSGPPETSTCMEKLLSGQSTEPDYKSARPAGAPLHNSATQQYCSADTNVARVCGVFCLCGVFALLALVGLARTQQGGGSGGFVRTQGTEFVLGGSPFLFNGFNSYWMMHVAADPGERQKVSDVFREAAAAGLSVCRTWAFSDGGDRALQVSPGVYDERVFQGLDFVVSEAQRYGIRLILSLVNNFNDFGGRQQYVQWARDAGVSINSDEDFYTNPVVKAYYRNHIKVGAHPIDEEETIYFIYLRICYRTFNTVTKMLYKVDPTIMAWELMNEPRCQADVSGKTVNAWAQEMAAYTKSLDGNHLLEVGMEGFFGDSMPEKKQYNPGYLVGTDFISTNLISEVDFATIHAYPDIWLSGQSDGSQDSFVERWMWSHWQDAMNVLKKPLVFAEFGKSKKDPGYSTAERDAYIDIVYNSIYEYSRSGRAFGGGLVWQIMAEGMESYYDGYEIVLSQDASTDAVIARQSHLMTVLSHTLSKPHGGLLTGATGVNAAQGPSGILPHAVHKTIGRSLRRHGRGFGRAHGGRRPHHCSGVAARVA